MYVNSAPIKKECLNLVESYTDEIIDMFVKEYTPRQICEELKLCKPDARPQLHSNDIPPIGMEMYAVAPKEKVTSVLI